MQRKGDQFWVEMPDLDWELENAANPNLEFLKPPTVLKQIVMTTGSHHMQAFWVTSNKRFQLHQLPWEFYIPDQKWVPSADAQVRPPEKQRPFGQWNTSCIKCHSVAGNPGKDPNSGELF